MVTDNRELKITKNIGLVHSIAHRFVGRGVDYDDLYQAGCMGLIKAVDGFDSTKGFAFSTYAVPVIMGEIRRIFRDGGPIKVSRSLKEKSIKVQAVRDKFVNKNLREPTLSELSTLTSIDINDLAEIVNIISPIISINSDDEDIDIPVNNEDEFFDNMWLHQSISTLTNVEQLLIKYRYFDGKTQVETAKMLNISQVQVSRKEKQILQKLKKLA